MKHLILVAAFAIGTPGLALAVDCPTAFDTAATHYIGNQTQQTVCLEANLARMQQLKQLQLDFAADLLAQQKAFELQLRLQQTQPVLPQVNLPNF